jgi:hypothetical protein
VSTFFFQNIATLDAIRAVFAIAVLLALTAFAAAQAGQLDPSFANNGIFASPTATQVSRPP